MFLSLFLGRKWGKNSGFATYASLPFFFLFFILCFTNNFWQIHITRHHCVTMSCSLPEVIDEMIPVQGKRPLKTIIENGHLKYTMETGVRHLPGMRLILASGEILSKLIC